MANDYYCIGLDITTDDDLHDFAMHMAVQTDFKHSEYGPYAVLQGGDRIELWYYGNEDGVNPYSIELYHRSLSIVIGSVWGWVRFPEDRTGSGLLSVFLNDANVQFPLNVEIVDAFLYTASFLEKVESAECELDLTLFARSMEISENEAKYYEKLDGRKGLAAEGCIPCGMFPLEGQEKNFVPTATVLLSGTVTEVERLENPLTGIAYWSFILSCLGHTFSVVAPLEYAKTLCKGNIVKGFFWASGKIRATVLTDKASS